jgi:hypothetical protein
VARARKAKREQARQIRKQVARVEREAGALPGGAADMPIEVGSAAVVEIKARATARGVLRELQLDCRSCHAPRTLWFRIAPSVAN